LFVFVDVGGIVDHHCFNPLFEEEFRQSPFDKIGRYS
jgi:hypothetical protein